MVWGMQDLKHIVQLNAPNQLQFCFCMLCFDNIVTWNRVNIIIFPSNVSWQSSKIDDGGIWGWRVAVCQYQDVYR
jgi:hypothetical protein